MSRGLRALHHILQPLRNALVDVGGVAAGQIVVDVTPFHLQLGLAYVQPVSEHSIVNEHGPLQLGRCDCTSHKAHPAKARWKMCVILCLIHPSSFSTCSAKRKHCHRQTQRLHVIAGHGMVAVRTAICAPWCCQRDAGQQQRVHTCLIASLSERSRRMCLARFTS
jgi:hypothetical protein